MKISYDKDTDSIYFLISESSTVVDSDEVRPGIIFDLDAQNQVVGIEIIGAGKRVSAEELKKILIDVA